MCEKRTCRVPFVNDNGDIVTITFEGRSSGEAYTKAKFYAKENNIRLATFEDIEKKYKKKLEEM